MVEQIGEDDVAAKVAGDGPRVDDGVEGADEPQDGGLWELAQVGESIDAALVLHVRDTLPDPRALCAPPTRSTACPHPHSGGRRGGHGGRHRGARCGARGRRYVTW